MNDCVLLCQPHTSRVHASSHNALPSSMRSAQLEPRVFVPSPLCPGLTVQAGEGGRTVKICSTAKSLSFVCDSAADAAQWIDDLRGAFSLEPLATTEEYKAAWRRTLEDDLYFLRKIAIVVSVALVLGEIAILFFFALQTQQYVHQYCFVPDEMKAQLDWLLIQSMDLLEEHHVRWWSEYGIVLGYEREGGEIPWDGDIDLGADATDMERMFYELEEVNAFTRIDRKRDILVLRKHFKDDRTDDFLVRHVKQTIGRGRDWVEYLDTMGGFDEPEKWDRQIEIWAFEKQANANYMRRQRSYMERDNRMKEEWLGGIPWVRLQPSGLRVRMPENTRALVYERYSRPMVPDLPAQCKGVQPLRHIPLLTKEPVHHYKSNYSLLYFMACELSWLHALVAAVFACAPLAIVQTAWVAVEMLSESKERATNKSL
eukprot:TRINITY_DN3146_c0_g1_i3.p1 TRINITY_DN3146_c0_g1~~TRINITY_DN3146_c0_g1_i3.p1  ORF type:complete len:428 (+),score=74.13 TRINITY_DN3146_c0_g1_i3:491-1774(+)